MFTVILHWRKVLPVCFVEGLQQREMLLSFNKRPQAFFDVSACP